MRLFSKKPRPETPAKQEGMLTRPWRSFRRHRLAMVGLFIISVFIICAIFAGVIAPYGYAEALFSPAQPPSFQHIMGTDDLGRDIFSRLIYGARISMSVGFVSQILILSIGVTLGVISGYYGRWVDNSIMRFTDMMFAFPSLLFAILIMVVLGRGLVSLFFAIGLVSWPFMARLVRGQVLSVKTLDFVEAARAAGARTPRILRLHILPNILAPVLVQVTFGMAAAILAESFLSFIGIGAPPPTPSWGLMVADGFRWIRVRPHMVIFPGVAISLTLLAFSFIGDGLRDALDPRTVNK